MTKARSNATANAAKGDLTVGTGTNLSGILSAGNNGEALVLDSSTATGLRWQGDYAAGKNKIINGDFGIWQRGTTFNSASSNTYFADRFTCYVGGGTHNITRQTFTPGTAPVAGYEGQYFFRWTSTVAGAVALTQRIENVQTFAGQTMTFSFWAKADSAVNISTAMYQVFGSGGSGAVSQTSGTQAITTSWARYSFTFNVASIAGKTIGTGSYLQLDINLPNAIMVFDTWGWQVEAGSVATAFQTATGTIQGELAACQRYYERFGQTANVILFNTMCYSTLDTYGSLPYLVQKRTTPTISISGTANFVIVIGGSTKVPTTSGASYISTKAARVQFNTTGLTAGQAAWIETDGGTNAFIEVSAEL